MYICELIGVVSMRILKQIASMGFPVPEKPRPRRTFKAVALAVIGTIRAR